MATAPESEKALLAGIMGKGMTIPKRYEPEVGPMRGPYSETEEDLAIDLEVKSWLALVEDYIENQLEKDVAECLKNELEFSSKTLARLPRTLDDGQARQMEIRFRQKAPRFFRSDYAIRFSVRNYEGSRGLRPEFTIFAIIDAQAY